MTDVPMLRTGQQLLMDSHWNGPMLDISHLEIAYKPTLSPSEIPNITHYKSFLLRLATRDLVVYNENH